MLCETGFISSTYEINAYLYIQAFSPPTHFLPLSRPLVLLYTKLPSLSPAPLTSPPTTSSVAPALHTAAALHEALLTEHYGGSSGSFGSGSIPGGVPHPAGSLSQNSEDSTSHRQVDLSEDAPPGRSGREDGSRGLTAGDWDEKLNTDHSRAPSGGGGGDGCAGDDERGRGSIEDGPQAWGGVTAAEVQGEEEEEGSRRRALQVAGYVSVIVCIKVKCYCACGCTICMRSTSVG